jgi:thiol-disulfide isomerase/thioredoxin
MQTAKWTISVWAAAGLLLVGCQAPTEAAGDTIPAFAEVTVTGDVLPEFQDPTVDGAVGVAAPVLSGIGLDGETVDVTPGTEPEVVLFVAHWCPHCEEEIPTLVDWLAGNDPVANLTVVATGTDPLRPNFPPGEWLRSEGLEVPIILDDQAGTAGQAYGLTAYPFWVAIGSDGTVLGRISGGLSADDVGTLFAAVAGS